MRRPIRPAAVAYQTAPSRSVSQCIAILLLRGRRGARDLVFWWPNPPVLGRPSWRQVSSATDQHAEVPNMTRTLSRFALIGGLFATTAGLLVAGAAAQGASSGFTTYENGKHGFSVIYSTSQFKALPATTPDGFQAVSK